MPTFGEWHTPSQAESLDGSPFKGGHAQACAVYSAGDTRGPTYGALSKQFNVDYEADMDGVTRKPGALNPQTDQGILPRAGARVTNPDDVDGPYGMEFRQSIVRVDWAWNDDLRNTNFMTPPPLPVPATALGIHYEGENLYRPIPGNIGTDMVRVPLSAPYYQAPDMEYVVFEVRVAMRYAQDDEAGAQFGLALWGIDDVVVDGTTEPPTIENDFRTEGGGWAYTQDLEGGQFIHEWRAPRLKRPLTGYELSYKHRGGTGANHFLNYYDEDWIAAGNTPKRVDYLRGSDLSGPNQHGWRFSDWYRSDPWVRPGDWQNRVQDMHLYWVPQTDYEFVHPETDEVDGVNGYVPTGKDEYGYTNDDGDFVKLAEAHRSFECHIIDLRVRRLYLPNMRSRWVLPDVLVPNGRSKRVRWS